MPVTSQIDSAIEPQNYEVIRDQIGAILFVELAAQHTLGALPETFDKIWIERFIGLDSPTEFPAINVNIAKGDYEGKTQRSVNGYYTYNIDVYTNATTTDATGPADQYAMVRMQRIVGIVRTILSAPCWNILGLTKGIIQTTMVDRFFIGDKSTVQDALSSVIGRIQFMVRAIERVPTAGGVPLDLAITQVYLKKTPEGFYVTDGSGDNVTDEDGNQLIYEDGSDQGFKYEYPQTP